VTTEERFERIEHLTVGIAEERRRDRDEHKTLWRDTQQQIDRATEATANLARQVDRLAIETRSRIAELAEQTRAADEQLGDRIGSLVSAIGQFIATRQQ
jgi:phage host-nuclease inhibitor protein Gam